MNQSQFHITIRKTSRLVVCMLIVLGCTSQFFAQTITKKEQMYGQCQKYFYANHFEEAIKIGEAIIKKSRRNKEFKYETIDLLAQAYRAKNNNYQAERWARILSNAKKTEYARAFYVSTMMSNEKYEKAKELGGKWLLDFPESKLLKLYVESCDSALVWYKRPHPLYNIRPLDEINSADRDFSPVHINDTLVFCSDRPLNQSQLTMKQKISQKVSFNSLSKKTTTGGLHNLNLYQIPLDINKDTLDKSQLHPWTVFSSERHEGPAAIIRTDSTERVFFTRTISNGMLYEREKLNVLHIFSSELIDGKWTTPEDFYPVNEDLYSTAHPAIGEEPNKLYFISDNPKGYGGTDIYYTEFINGLWQKPVNLGPSINTAGNELFPYVDGNKLYFSSDGHPGMGRLDIFEATDIGNGTWDLVTNLQPPVNTAFDDFGFSTWSNPSNVFFSTNRSKDSYNDELYVGSRNNIETIYLIGQDMEFESNRFFDHISFEIKLDDEPIPLTQIKNRFIFTPEKQKDYRVSYNLKSFKQNEVVVKNTLRNTKTEIFRDEVITGAKPINIIGTLKRGGFPVADHDILVLKNGIPLDTIVTNHEGDYSYVIPANEDYELIAHTRLGEQQFKQKDFVEVDITVLAMSDSTPLSDVLLETILNDQKHKNFSTDNAGKISFTAKNKDRVGVLINHKGYFKIDTLFDLASDSVVRIIYEYVFYLEKRKDFQYIGRVISRENAESLTLISNAEIRVLANEEVIDELQSSTDGMFRATLFDGASYRLVISKPGYFQLDSQFVAKTSQDTNDFVLKKIQKNVDINLDDIYFDFNSYLLNVKSKHTLENLIRFMRQNPKELIQINAHTDARGNDALNMELSQKRADEIKKYLVTAGINKARMKSVGYGESQLVIKDAKTDEEHELNRRSQFKIIDQLTYEEFHPEKTLKSNDKRYFLKLMVEQEPLDTDHPVFKTFPNLQTAINGKEVVYFIGPFERKTQIELELNKIKESKLDIVPVGVLRYRNKKEIY